MGLFFSPFAFQFAFTRLGEGTECKTKQKEKEEEEKEGEGAVQKRGAKTAGVSHHLGGGWGQGK